MLRPRKIAVLLILWICSTGAFASRALADPLRFENVRASSISRPDQVGLFDNPGRVLTLENNLLIFWIDLVGTLAPGQTDVLRLTFRASSGETRVQEFGVPVFGTTLPPLTLLTKSDLPNKLYAAAV